jgi:NAD(P)H-nitrite reductase large subunit
MAYIPFKHSSFVFPGPAGSACVETLRQEGFRGRIVFVCKEPALPYDRVKTSKALDVKLDSITFRTPSFYKVSFSFAQWLKSIL